MTATYGPTEGSLAVGIDVSMSPSTVTKDTSSVTLTWTVYAKAYYAFEDPQTLTLSNAFSATKNYYLSAPDWPNVTVYKIGTWTQTVSTSYNGTVSKTLVAGISGVFNGATPSHSRTITIPKRPPQIPDPATSATVSMTSASSATISWTRPTNADSNSDLWENVVINRSVNGGPLNALVTLAGTATSYVNSGLSANTSYQYTVYAKNDSGNSSPVTAGTIQTTLPTPTSVTPASGATVTVPNPTLGGTFSAIAGGNTGKLAWQLAKNSSFTDSPIWIYEDDADLTVSGTHTEALTIDQLSLSNGTWWIRAWVVDNNEMTGPYSTAQSFTVNVPALPTPTTVTPASGASVTTMRPTLGATIVSDAAGRKQKAEWQLATNSGFTSNVRFVTESDTDFRTSGATTEVVSVASQITMDLGTTWYIRARSIGNDGSISGWSTGTSFTLSVTAPPVPTAVSPSASSTIATNTPTLYATLGAATESRTVKAEWQLATDSGFTANVRTITESDADLRTSGATTQGTPVGSKLFQGTWYIRAREIDQYGQAGSYSAGQSFTVSHPPVLVPKTPVNNSTLQWAATTQFSWTFTDTSATDTPSAYQLVIERNDTGASVYDSGKVTSTAVYVTAAISASYKDVILRWKVRAWDNDNIAGPYTSYNLVTLSDPPVVTITSPTNAQVINVGQPTITWTNDVSTVQASRRVVITRDSDGVTVHDSKTASTTSTTYTTPNIVLENGGSYTATVTVTDTVGMTGSATRSFSAQYDSPDPVVTLWVDESVFDDLGYVQLGWAGTTPDGYFVQWNIYRRPVGTDDWTLIFASTDPELAHYKDWLVPSGSVYEYAATQSAGRFGSVIESPVTQTESRAIEGSHYWLINPLNEDDNLKLSNVVSDSYTDDYDEAELIIIDRGRKVNHGTRYGYSGSLTAQLRDDDEKTAREKRILLQTLKAARTTYYLRNPFGDMIEISIGNLGIARVPGVGTSEYVDVTIPYREVF